MKYIFNVNNSLYVTSNYSTILADSINFVQSKFVFDSLWDTFTKSITFVNLDTNVSVNAILDVDNVCTIPWECLETGGRLIAVVKGVSSSEETIYTKMVMPLKIKPSDKVIGLDPTDPTPSVYDQILVELGNKYVDTISETKEISLDDYVASGGVQTVSQYFQSTLVTESEVILASGWQKSFLDKNDYPYEEFSLQYTIGSKFGIVQNAVPLLETVSSVNSRIIVFEIENNIYELTIRETETSLIRISGDEDIYIKGLSFNFDVNNYYYCNYNIEGLTTYHKSIIFIQNSSRDMLKEVSFLQYPEITDGSIRLCFNKKPSRKIVTNFFAYKTDEIQGVEIVNILGNVVYSFLNTKDISEVEEGTDGFNNIPTVYDIINYVTYKLNNFDLSNYSTLDYVDQSIDYLEIGNYATIEYVDLNYAKTIDLPTELPASDVYDWAKRATKPVYGASEVGALSDSTLVPTKVSELDNDLEFISVPNYPEVSGIVSELAPNKYYNFGEVSDLDLSLGDAIDGYVSEYSFEFQCPATVLTSITLPISIKWVNNIIPEIVYGKTYVCSIVNNLGIMAEW